MTVGRLSALDFFHFMSWRLRCLEAGGNAFQKLFEDAMQRLEPETFQKVRPYGKLGDRKTDGLLYGEGVVYQVYSPNLLKLTEVKTKIRDDLTGAVKFWGEELERWVFVFNGSRGVADGGAPADVYYLLREQGEKYSDVEVVPLSDEGLWERVRGLPPGARHEFLGTPPGGWEGIFVPPVGVEDDAMEGLDNSRIVIIHDLLGPADRKAVLEALAPERPFGTPLRLAPDPEEIKWKAAATHQGRQVKDLIDRAASHLSRFAVFPLSPIPLLVHLGFVLADTKDVDLYQYHRDSGSWRWEDAPENGGFSLDVEGVPESVLEDDVEVAVRVSISAPVHRSTTLEAVGELPVEVDIRVPDPSRDWLVRPDQVVEYRRRIRQLQDELMKKVPNCRRIHLFLAVPAPLAVATGQSINPRMTPPVELYEYDRPSYRPVLELPV